LIWPAVVVSHIIASLVACHCHRSRLWHLPSMLSPADGCIVVVAVLVPCMHVCRRCSLSLSLSLSRHCCRLPPSCLAFASSCRSFPEIAIIREWFRVCLPLAADPPLSPWDVDLRLCSPVRLELSSSRVNSMTVSVSGTVPSGVSIVGAHRERSFVSESRISLLSCAHLMVA